MRNNWPKFFGVEYVWIHECKAHHYQNLQKLNAINAFIKKVKIFTLHYYFESLCIAYEMLPKIKQGHLESNGWNQNK